MLATEERSSNWLAASINDVDIRDRNRIAWPEYVYMVSDTLQTEADAAASCATKVSTLGVSAAFDM